MKKLSAMLVAFILVAATAFTAFAAGINDSEQAVLNELKTSVKMNGSEMVIPSEFVNQAENYFNTIDMSHLRSLLFSRRARASLRTQVHLILQISHLLRSRHFFLTVRKLSVCLV